MRIVIVGGGAAGASCAARLRRLNEDAEIIIIERTNEVSIANCGLPYYVSGVINAREKILVSTPEKFKSWFNIDVLLNTEVLRINRNEKTVNLSSGKDLRYDKLVLAQGASPIVPPFEGMNKDKTFIVRNLNDADKIKNYIQQNNSKKAVIVGGGFIGIEMAENLVEMGIDTTLVELGNQILAPVDEEIASVAQNEMRDNGVNLILSDGVKSFDGDTIILNSGVNVPFDFVVLAIGVRPETALAKVAGLEVNRGILVNEYMQTTDADIYAAGDSVEIKDFVTGDNTLIPLAGPANRQGRIIADNISGGVNSKLSTYKNSQGTSVLKVFALTVASVGNNEKQLKQKQIPYWKTLIYGHSHAGYYPGSTQTLYKLLFTPEGKILGAQAVGQEDVEKRIDVISSVMRNGGAVQELIDSELCYAPPYNSAKDSGVNILGMSADNILKGFIKPAYFEDLEGSYLIDVRPNIAYKTKTIEGAVNIPINEIRSSLNEIPTDKKVILFCNTGYTSYCASRILVQKGFNNVYSLMGGITLYKEIVKNKEGKVTAKIRAAVGASINNSKVSKIDACGLQCPGPIMKVSNALNNAKEGDIFEVTSTDRGFKSDIGAWCESTGNTFVNLKQDGVKYIATISKGASANIRGSNMENKVINNGWTNYCCVLK